MNKHELLELRRECHHLKPVIWLGNQGYTDAVAAEIERALDSHELIKIKVNTSDKTERDKLANHLCEAHQAELIQRIGQTVCIYRESDDNK